VFLGTDEAIKVDAKPAVKFQDTQGLFRKSNTMAVKLKSIITNNKKSPVSITVKEQLPKSTDSSVKITLTVPDLAVRISVSCWPPMALPLTLPLGFCFCLFFH
jgi:hypothetical protein